MDYLPSEIQTMGNSLISDPFFWPRSPTVLVTAFCQKMTIFFISFLSLVFYILFFLLWVAGTNVHSVMNHTQQTCLWTCILTNTIPGIKPGGKYSNVCFVTNHSLQKSVWIIISMPYMVRKEMLSKSVVIFDRETADLLFFQFLFELFFPFSIPFLFKLLWPIYFWWKIIQVSIL